MVFRRNGGGISCCEQSLKGGLKKYDWGGSLGFYRASWGGGGIK